MMPTYNFHPLLMVEESVTFPALVYIFVIVLGGIACLIHFLMHGRPLRSLQQPGPYLRVAGWTMRASDFALGVMVLIFFITTGQLLALQVIGTLDNTGETLSKHLVSGFMFHFSAILTIVALYRFFPTHFSPFNTRRLAWPSALSLGSYAFFASMPLVFLLAYFWQQILEVLNLPTDQQEVVAIFANIESWQLLVALILLTVVVAPISEEVIFRGCLYRFLKGKAPAFVAVIFTSGIFALLHWNWLSLIPLFVLGIVLTYAYERTGNLKVPILLHSIFNANTVILLFLTHDVA